MSASKEILSLPNLSLNRKTGFLLVLGCSLSTLWTCWTFTRPSEEQKIRRVLQEIERAAEHKELLKLLSYVSDDYEDDMGFDRHSLATVGNEIFKTYQQVFIHVRDLTIEVKGKEARAHLTATVLASRAEEEKENLLTERGSDRFLVTFHAIDHAWKIVRSEIPPSAFE